MKKFGTPNGAGPGSANEKVGFAAVGTPDLVVVAVDLVFGLAGFETGATVTLPAPPAFWLTLECGLTVPEEEDDEELEPELPEEAGAEVVDEVVVVVDVVVEVLGAAHVAFTFLTGPVPGGTRADTGVPAGTFTLKVSV